VSLALHYLEDWTAPLAELRRVLMPGGRGLHAPGDLRPTATERAGGWWEVTHWPRFFDRNQAITALTVTELLETGRDSGDPLVVTLGQELLDGPADQAHCHARPGQGPRRYRP
jgi:hypothetical protein